MKYLQIEINFETKSPINTDKINGQNKRLIEFLLTGAKINCFSPEVQSLKIGVFHSRIAEARKFFKENGVELKSEMTEFKFNGEKTHAKNYWI